MKVITISTLAQLKKQLAEKGVSIHLTDACGSQSGDLSYPDGMAEADRARIREEMADFLSKEGVDVAFSKRGDGFWVRQG